jgi:uncharacterized protein (TIGR00730 family)
MSIQKVSVYCGSSSGFSPEFTEAAESLGKYLAVNNMTLVYGGGNVGLMGTVANAVLDNGGSVIGVITTRLHDLELGHTGCQTLHIVESMHQRKMLMATLADAFIALPGGFGTLEELAEMATWAQLNIHSKPVGLLNVLGYYDLLISWMDHANGSGFLRNAHRPLVVDDTSPLRLFQKMANIRFPRLEEALEIQSPKK